MLPAAAAESLSDRDYSDKILYLFFVTFGCKPRIYRIKPYSCATSTAETPRIIAFRRGKVNDFTFNGRKYNVLI